MTSTFFSETILCLVAAVLFLTIIILLSGIKVVPEEKRLHVHRLGRDIGTKGPGMVFIIPFIDLARLIDWPEQDHEL